MFHRDEKNSIVILDNKRMATQLNNVKYIHRNSQPRKKIQQIIK